MKNKNSQNTKDSSSNPILDKIIDILNLDKGETKIEEETIGSKKLIDNILKKHNKNQLLALYLVGEVDSNYYKDFINTLGNDKKLALTAIRASSKNFDLLNENFKKDLEFGFDVVKSFVREGNNFLEIKKFIEINFLDDKQKILKFYRDYINKVDKILVDDLTKNLVNLSENNPDFFELLKTKKIIFGKHDKLIINPKFLNDFEIEFEKNNNLKGLDYEGIKKLKIGFLIKYLGLQNEEINENILFIINSIIDLSNIKNDKKTSNEEKKDKGDDLEEKSDKNITKDKKNDTSEEDDNYYDKLDYCSPNCSISSFSGGYYHIETSGNFSIKISKEEKTKFTSLALKNFIKFYQKLYKLGLNFLWDKYKTDFITLSNNKFGFNYMNGEGITESKTLSVLNLIGKNIGIPEKEILLNDGKIKKETKCFKTVGDAELKFEEIKKTGKINQELYSDNGMFSSGAVEKKLEENECIDINGKGLNITNWK